MVEKRKLDDKSSTHKSKKAKVDKVSHSPSKPTSNLVSDEVDFPRGGGTTFTPLEVKTFRAEAVREAERDLFKDTQLGAKVPKKRRKSEVKRSLTGKNDGIRIEHLNYKRLDVGMKILGQIVSVHPLALVISLPNQLLAHAPITHISSQLTALLEAAEEENEIVSSEEDGDDEPTSKSRVPDLHEIFSPGQYVRTVVTAIHEPGSNDMTGIGKTMDPVLNASRRVELSLTPERVNAGVQKIDLRTGYTMSAAVKSLEDHGYILDLGVPEVSGFLSFKDAKKGPFDKNTRLHVGRILDVTIAGMMSNGRTCKVNVDSATFSSSSLSEVSNATSILPGTLVQSLVTSVRSNGLNLQILGFFEGTVDQFHLGLDSSAEPYKAGKKLKARVLYSFSSTPPRFVLSLKEHVIGLCAKSIGGESSSGVHIQEAYPIGKILEGVTVLRTEEERGLIVSVQPGLEGFVHISQTSDDHVPSLPSNSGPWKSGTVHKARVTGYILFDGLLQLSLRQSVLEQKFLQVEDVKVGEVLTATVKKLTDAGLFLSLSGNISGVVWPRHFADISLKHPEKRFKVGKDIRCRVLAVDSERKRISLTTKRTLLESTLPILSKLEDVTIGLVSHAVVLKVFDKNLIVEFYNNLKATVPSRETSESPTGKLSDSFDVGKVVKVRVLSVDLELPRIVASIRQAGSISIPDISTVEIGNIVEGKVSEIHKDNAILSLQPTQVRALISLKNLANHRSITLAQLRASLNQGAKLEGLVVVSRYPERGFVIVANGPKAKISLPAKSTLSMDTIGVGQMVGGRVTRHARNGALVKLNAHIGGILHPTDTSDNYESGSIFPAVDSVLKAIVVSIDRARNQLMLSTRHSRMYPDQHKPVVDREINNITDLQPGDTVRGFIKNVAEHGLFVTLGREVDARVQIKELFDEYVKDWKGRFESNQLVKGRILSIDIENKKVEMTFRSENLTKDPPTVLTHSDLQEGQKVEGRVKKIEDYGLFLEIKDSKLTGLCHKSELSDNKDADVVLALRSFREGDVVKAIILSVDIVKRRISMGLKPSYFADDNQEENDEPPAKKNPEPADLGVVDQDDMSELGNLDTEDNDTSSHGDVEGDDESMHIDMDVQTHLFNQQSLVAKTSSSLAPAPLKLQGGFQWSGSRMEPVTYTDASSSEECDEQEQPGKKKKRRRKEIEQDITADLQTKTPESNADFERFLLGSPNSSYLWIQYMSFQVQLSEVEKAREVGRRALQTINFREEQEKLNVWIALLNLENVYGTDETLESTFKDAARHNDSKTVHLRLAFILDQAEKHEKAEEQYKRTCKKFGQSSKVWTLFGEYYLRRGETEQARKLLPRSLQSLEKRKHLKTISKFAQLEYKLGDPERGKTIFEGIVDSHPKRWDLWSIYMDMETIQGDIQSLRNLFDRVLAIKMTSHKAKSFFKKWLSLERTLGDEDGATMVKQKAVEWTQKATDS